jgi:CBS domain-containing protein
VAHLVRDLMSTRVVSVRSDTTVAAAVERMVKYGFSALPVVSPHHRLLGVVSLLDVIRYREAHAEEGLEADEQAPVTEIMNPEVVTMAATAKVAAVARRLTEGGQLRVLPVVDGGRLVGIVTRGDLLRGAPATPRPSGLDRLLGGSGGEDEAERAALLALARQRRTGPPPPAGTPVTAVMTTQVVTVAPDDPVAMAGQLMLRDRHPSLPVVEADGALVGIISEADILADPFAGRRAHAAVRQVMSASVLAVDRTTTVGEARSLVADHGVRMLPVVDGGRLVGVLSRSDLV